MPDGITDEEEAVRSAKGFFISRYEAGKKGTGTLVSKKGAIVWTNISQVDAKTTSKTMFTDNSNVKSALISGIQWDMTMGFINGKMDGMGKTYDVTKTESSRHVGGRVTISGNNEADKVCNIYDLEGNASEYIAEKTTYYTDGSFVKKVGRYDEIMPASNRGNSNGRAHNYDTFRVVLYVV